MGTGRSVSTGNMLRAGTEKLEVNIMIVAGMELKTRAVTDALTMLIQLCSNELDRDIEGTLVSLSVAEAEARLSDKAWEAVNELFSAERRLIIAVDEGGNDFIDEKRNELEKIFPGVTFLQPHEPIVQYCKRRRLKKVWAQDVPRLQNLDRGLERRLKAAGLETYRISSQNAAEAEKLAVEAADLNDKGYESLPRLKMWEFWACIQDELTQNGVELVLLQDGATLMPQPMEIIAQQEGMPISINVMAMFLRAIQRWIKGEEVATEN